MMRRLFVTLACALAPVALLSGCGGSHTATGPTSGLSVKTVKRLNKVDTARSVAECHQAADNPGLAPAQKPLMQTECEYIRTGNNAGLRIVDRQLCYLQAAEQPEPERTNMRAQCKQL